MYARHIVTILVFAVIAAFMWATVMVVMFGSTGSKGNYRCLGHELYGCNKTITIYGDALAQPWMCGSCKSRRGY